MARRHVAAVIATTLALGFAVAVSWLVFGGAAAFGAPIPVLGQSWPLIYGSQAALAAGIGWLVAVALPHATLRTLAAAISTAWLGEGAVLLVGGTLLANELVPEAAWFFWLIGTGGPVQPLAAVAGAAAAKHASERHERKMAVAPRPGGAHAPAMRVVRRILIAIGSLVTAYLAVGLVAGVALQQVTGSPSAVTDPPLSSAITIVVLVLGGLIYRDIMRRELPAAIDRQA